MPERGAIPHLALLPGGQVFYQGGGQADDKQESIAATKNILAIKV